MAAAGAVSPIDLSDGLADNRQSAAGHRPMRVTWPGSHGSTFTAVAQPRSECIERSRTRLGDWSRRWPDVFGDMSGPWLSYVHAVERAYLAVLAEQLS